MIPDKDKIKALKKEYPVGTRVELIKMDDFQAPPIGTKGTVAGVDGLGNILMRWDNGSSLSVIIDEDIIRKVEK